MAGRSDNCRVWSGILSKSRTMEFRHNNYTNTSTQKKVKGGTHVHVYGGWIQNRFLYTQLSNCCIAFQQFQTCSTSAQIPVKILDRDLYDSLTAK